ncbi:expressed unknown protein [Seminavis robusta]|uniref:MYND-type domain-containing protein n=1 Tax=Seminavis robusta TaxID=568900 RepID=A0A9N8HCR5_9STRA|nr:expressed unknown protein [Seminavis robusta]|eukprot:Sro313_g114810.1 n/a (558) ;mRNA; r:36315-38147
MNLEEKVKLCNAFRPFLRDEETSGLKAQLRRASAANSKSIVRRLLQKAGTNCDLNDADPYGNGDQTPIVKNGEHQAQILRDLFNDCEDLENCLREYDQRHIPSVTRMSPFVWNCIRGDRRAVETELKALSTFEARTNLLEYRVTAMRMSPLIITIACSKHPKTVHFYTNQPVKLMKHVEVVRILLQYGASPNAKDVTGKTACHYGAGSCATKDTLSMTDMCIRANETSTFVGRGVVLDGLGNQGYNEMVGTLGGFVSETGRRVFHPVQNVNEEMAVKPDNIFVQSNRNAAENEATRSVCIMHKSLKAPNIVEVQDRIGTISLHEVVQSNQRDVAKFLLKRSTNGLDIADCSGWTVRQMSMTPIRGANPVNDVIHAYVKETVKKENRNSRRNEVCENCGVRAGHLGELLQCTKCLDAVYCGKKCQITHWKAAHRRECAEREQMLGLICEAAEVPDDHTSFSHATETTQSQFHCRPPKGLKQKDTFWVKIQSSMNQLMIYDKTRHCNFYMDPSSLGFQDLFQSVADQAAFLGKKSYYRAKINEDGQFVIYPHTSTVKTW